MSYTGYGALWGKARDVRNRSRFHRHLADEQIFEYAEGGFHAHSPARHIPIRHRSEFLPTLVMASANGLAIVSNGNHGSEQSSSRTVQPAGGLDMKTQSGTQAAKTPAPVIRLPVRSRSALPVADSRFKFTWRGFGAGCAMGAAAAAVLVLLLHSIAG